ncbi:hypothetical protein [Shimazuella alba]|uniref:Uncharacterized protein n=1 Tax=Shimazuella alba TaxID=2690964 RepID=A0A6I4W1W5_9BACL|nr:hypothetical protein [Shimazuella alba]MXQ54764.1 hypothetical protein [Shimazuella alba]
MPQTVPMHLGLRLLTQHIVVLVTDDKHFKRKLGNGTWNDIVSSVRVK